MLYFYNTLPLLLLQLAVLDGVPAIICTESLDCQCTNYYAPHYLVAEKSVFPRLCRSPRLRTCSCDLFSWHWQPVMWAAWPATEVAQTVPRTFRSGKWLSAQQPSQGQRQDPGRNRLCCNSIPENTPIPFGFTSATPCAKQTDTCCQQCQNMYHHVINLLCNLHWLLIWSRSTFKVASLCYTHLHSNNRAICMRNSTCTPYHKHCTHLVRIC